MNHHSPPAVACWLIECVLPAPCREAMLGDLMEEYALRVKSTSSRAASRWFWAQTCRSVPFIVWSSLRSENWLISTAVAVGVYVAMGMLKLAADLIITKWVAPQQMTYVILAPAVFLAITAIGGCLAARMRRTATILLALFVLITVAVLIQRSVCTVPVPWWYQFGFFTLGPLTVLLTPAIFWSFKARPQAPAT